jgi:hypothetical protein
MGRLNLPIGSNVSLIHIPHSQRYNMEKVTIPAPPNSPHPEPETFGIERVSGKYVCSCGIEDDIIALHILHNSVPNSVSVLWCPCGKVYHMEDDRRQIVDIP